MTPRIIHVAERMAERSASVLRAILLHEATHSADALRGIDIPAEYGELDSGVPAGEAFSDCVSSVFEPDALGDVGYLPDGCPTDLQDHEL
ncbi:hypothetical protein [Microbacterium sp. YY-01]|uniref:hypothetical protein n=1 Tax=Microbacterium sp. YY-01 TaxID=3421634 RepID=UPI003D18211A